MAENCIEREIEDISEDGFVIFVCVKTGFGCVDEDLKECGFR